ncbi:MAG: hypothetical protein AB7O48_16845 [Cyclobacteriaceae bacterium]
MAASAFHGRQYAIHQRFNNRVIVFTLKVWQLAGSIILFVDEYCIYNDKAINSKKTSRIL